MNVYLKELSSALSGCPQTQIDIFTRVQSLRLDKVKTVAPNVRVIHLPAGPNCPQDRRLLYDYLPEFADNLEAFIREERRRYDIVYTHYWLSGLVGEYLKQCLDIPLVHTYHTLALLKKRVSGEQEHQSRLLAEQHLSQFSDLIISSSSEEQRSLILEYGIPTSKIKVIYPGVNRKLFQPAHSQMIYEEAGFSEKDQILLYVGRIEPVKGLMTVIDAMGMLNEHKDPLAEKLRLVVIGGGDRDRELSQNREVARIRKTVEEKNLTDKVVFLGSKEQNILKAYYSSADVLIVPSLYESFGLVVVESLACGTPVLVSSVGKMKTIVKEGKNGFSFVPGCPASLAEVIQKFYRRKNFLWQERRIRQDIIDKFSWEKTGKETCRALADVKNKNLFSTRKFQRDESPQLA
jgi:D-inositol-3-phosphate glycosyltransferase